MTDSVFAWVVLALLLFWSVGAYNRLVRLRSLALATFQRLGHPLGSYPALVDEIVKTSPDLLAPAYPPALGAEAAAAWTGLQAASAQFDVCWRVVRRQPLDAEGMAALQTALAVLQTAWKNAREAHLGSVQLLPPRQVVRWAENDQLVAHAAAGFNAAVLAYNTAITQFPALLMARLFAFRVAGCL